MARQGDTVGVMRGAEAVADAELFGNSGYDISDNFTQSNQIKCLKMLDLEFARDAVA